MHVTIHTSQYMGFQNNFFNEEGIFNCFCLFFTPSWSLLNSVLSTTYSLSLSPSLIFISSINLTSHMIGSSLPFSLYFSLTFFSPFLFLNPPPSLSSVSVCLPYACVCFSFSCITYQYLRLNIKKLFLCIFYPFSLLYLYI